VETIAQVFAVEAEVRFAAGTDTRAPGGAVTVALCGHWDHDGPCRWPHHTDVDTAGDVPRVRVVYAVTPQQQPHVRALIEGALRCGEPAWRADKCGPSPLKPEESLLAERISQPERTT
jgi:hypothetical protein